MRIAVVAVIVAAIAVLITGLVPVIARDATMYWGDFSALGFGLALLVAWGVGSVAFSPRSPGTGG